MARQLYRVYLYTVSIALLILAAVGLGALLNTVLAYTSLRGAYRVEPGQRELVQGLVFAVTAWIIAATLGFIHLRLIRRDMTEYPEASRGAVRAFFLNGAEAIGVLVTVIAGAGAFTTLAATDSFGMGDSAGPFATALAALLLVAVLEIERRRLRATPGAATIFQRLHTFGVPLILLLITTFGYWNTAMRTSVTGVLIRANLYNPLDPNACGTDQFGPIQGPCSLQNAGFLWLAALVPIAAIALYALMTREDLHSLIRTVAHIGGLSLGVGMLLFGLDRGIELLLRGVFGVPVGWGDVAHPWTASYDFISPLSIGVILAVVYGLWIRAEKADLPPGAQTTRLATEAVVTVIFAAAFWWGIGRLAYTALQWFGSSGGGSFAERWAAAIALAVAGLAYIPLAVHLRLSTAQTENSTPRRGFILAMLAGGIITGAVGLTITLYTLGTNLLGAPLNNWQQTVRGGLAALVVGLILVVSYGWTALQERSISSLFKRLREATAIPAIPATPAQALETKMAGDAGVTAAIEQVLKEYEAHGIDLHEATERIKTFIHTTP
jgi:hypothetical protein